MAKNPNALRKCIQAGWGILIQELLYKIPTPKLTIPGKVDQPLRYLKYLILIVMVFILPFFVRSEYGVGAPFFCKYICPLGAFYGLFQKISLIRMRVDENSCVDCGKCARTCRMNVDPHKTPNSNECIRCTGRGTENIKEVNR